MQLSNWKSFSRRTIPGWIFFVLGGTWKLFEFWSTSEFVIKKLWPGNPIIKFLSPIVLWHWFPFILMMIGLAWILWTSRPIVKLQAPSPTILEDTKSLYNAWLKPTAKSGREVMQRIMGAMRDHEDKALQSHVGLIQRSIVDEEQRAFARLTNILEGRESIDDTGLMDCIGSYYRSYQAVRTLICQGIGLTGIDIKNDPIFQEWLRLDERLLGELRQFSGPSKYDQLRKQLNAVGWGENVTRDLRNHIIAS